MKKLKSVYYSLIAILLIQISAFSQAQSDFRIFYSPDNYTKDCQKLLSNQDYFEEYRLMISGHIDPKNTGNVDKELFAQSIVRYYPDKLANGILCIDLENKAYSNLVKLDQSTAEFKDARDQFIWMIRKVKELRPNVKVGFYGLPIRVYYFKTSVTSNKLDEILSVTDYIFPSLYTMYPNSEIGKPRNEKYLRENLEAALDYGSRLNKPVIPFIWDIVHPSNKKNGGQLVSKDEMQENINFIKSFKYKNKGVVGIVWWDPDYKSFARMNKSKLNIEEKEPKFVQSQIMKDYLSSYIRN